MEDERHTQRRLVGEDAVRRLPVLPERLAVVGGEDDERPLARGCREERLEERPEGGVRGRHLALVGLVREGGRQRGRRLVREVRLVQVDERKPLLAADRVDPSPGRAHRVLSRPLGHGEGGRARSSHPVVVHLEPAVEPEARVERERADEGPGAPALLAQDRGEGRPVRGETEARVVVNPVAQRVVAGEQVGVRGQGHHVVRPCRLEADALGRQAVDPRRPRVAAAVAAERVRAQRVDGHEEDAEPGVARHARGARARARRAWRRKPRRRASRRPWRCGAPGLDPTRPPVVPGF